MASSIPLSKIDKERVLEVGRKAANLGGQVLLDYFGHLTKVEEKEMAGLVSEADLESERVIVEYLKQNFPQSDILGEEGAFKEGEIPEKSKSQGRWIIDPLDGTTNYVHQLPLYCVSIGYEWNGEVVVGVIYVPFLKDCYWATAGGGAFKNSQKISVSKRGEIQNSLLATGFFPPDKSALKEQLEIFSVLIDKVRGLRRLGAAAYDLCLVAEGVFDAFWEKNLKPWDTSAGYLLVKEAGGTVTDYSGAGFDPFCDSIVAGNSDIQPKLQQLINKTISQPR